MLKVYLPALALAAALSLSACGQADQPEAAPGAVEAVTARIDSNEAAVKEVAATRADLRAQAEATRSAERLAASARSPGDSAEMRAAAARGKANAVAVMNSFEASGEAPSPSGS